MAGGGVWKGRVRSAGLGGAGEDRLPLLAIAGDLQAVFAGDGGFRYRPNGFFSGVDQFRYQVDDGLGALATGVALIQVTAVDTPVTVVAGADIVATAPVSPYAMGMPT